MRGLSAFQDAFAAALSGAAEGLAPWLADPESAPGLSVYRNTTAKGCADALAASFPTVERLVGSDWMRAAALAYARQRAPASAAMLAYGADFPDWLARFEPAAALPYLGGVASLDRLWIEAHLAADAEPMDAAALAGLDAEALQRTAVVAHPAVRLAWFDANIVSLWAANRPPAEPPEAFELSQGGEGVLIARPGLGVEHHLLGFAAYAFLSACFAGASLADAAARAATAEPSADIFAIVALSLEAGAFVGLRTLSES